MEKITSLNVKRTTPWIVRDGDGKRYELDFNRDSVVRAEEQGFTLKVISEMKDGKVASVWSRLFYFSFYRYPEISNAETNEILFNCLRQADREKIIFGLLDMFTDTYDSLFEDSEQSKNSKWSVE